MVEQIRVLHVDDSEQFLKISKTHLERCDPEISVTTTSSRSEAVSLIEKGVVDCVVSDYVMTEFSGADLLEDVRDMDSDLPFILFTGRDYDAISDVIRDGATDCFQKGSTEEQYVVLANRIENAVSAYQNQQELRELVSETTKYQDRLEEVINILSHDLRNPLHVANTYLSTAQIDEDFEMLDAVEDGISRADSLIDDLLTLAKEGEPVEETMTLDLRDVANDVWTDVSGTDDASLTVENNLTVDASRQRLRTVFLNLFQNALHHGEASEVRIRTDPSGNGFYVEDDGVGVAADQVERIFSHGYTTTENGTGLGLPIVRRIADAHEWTVSATTPDSETDSDTDSEESYGLRIIFSVA